MTHDPASWPKRTRRKFNREPVSTEDLMLLLAQFEIRFPNSHPADYLAQDRAKRLLVHWWMTEQRRSAWEDGYEDGWLGSAANNPYGEPR